MLDKSRALAVDCVAYDLEDSVSMDMKVEARRNLRSFLALPKPSCIKERAVRINAVGSGLEEDDLAEVCKAPYLDTILIPKVNTGSDLRWISDYLHHNCLPCGTLTSSNASSRPLPKILALIESARALSNLSSICTASPLLSGLIFAAEDFAFDLSLTRTPSLTEFLYARSAIVTAARAHDLPSAIDLVCTSYKDEAGRRRMEGECENGKTIGFNGKQCIHPSQVELAQKAFSPGAEELEWAVRISAADEKAGGRGAWALEGKMIDVPVVKKARAIVERAGVCGFDVRELKEKWKDQEPE